ncbi:hypothetical protein EJB05_54672, partial [Eragrostis curvula]
METEATTPATYPRWVLLARNGDDEYMYEDKDQYMYIIGDKKTAAACFTPDGEPIRISLRFAAPPVTSLLWVHFPEDGIGNSPRVIAVHGDALLIVTDFTVLHFVYSAGDRTSSSRRPPSLKLLPHCYFIVREIMMNFCTVEEDASPRGFFIEELWDHTDKPRMLNRDATGLLRRGKDAFVVAKLQMAPSEYRKPAAELLLLQSGKWSVKRASISHGGDKCRELFLWRTDTVGSVGDRLLCWVDFSRGVMFANVLDNTPELQYVSFPVKPRYSDSEPKTSRNVCATAGGAVKLVDVFTTHRCGCDGMDAATKCSRSCCPCTVETWTLRMDDMVWVMDGRVDAAELCALEAWQGLPRVKLEYPVVSVDDPNLICFLVWDEPVKYYEKQWMVMVDMRSKTVQSVCRRPDVCRNICTQRQRHGSPQDARID